MLILLSRPHLDYGPERHGPMRETMHKNSLYQPLHVVEGVTDTGQSDGGIKWDKVRAMFAHMQLKLSGH